MPRQRRSRCDECRREWVFRTTGPEWNCPACGSPEIAQVEFHGLFDIDTPADVTARALIDADAEAEAAARAKLTGQETTIQPPPLALSV